MARAKGEAETTQAVEPKWPAYAVVKKPLSWLKPYERNARTHGDAQIAQLRGSLKQFGWTIPVLAREDGTIYEPFSGSGTTIIAAEMTGRVCHAIEIDPAYVDVAIKRWQDFTGLKATMADDGRTFDEIAAERLKRAA